MKLTYHVSKRLLSYSATAIAVMATSTANSNVVVNADNLTLPLSIMPDDSFGLDLDGDGIDDYTFSANQNTTTFIGASNPIYVGTASTEGLMSTITMPSSQWTFYQQAGSAYVSFNASFNGAGSNGLMIVQSGYALVRAVGYGAGIGDSESFQSSIGAIGGGKLGEWQVRSYSWVSGTKGSFSYYGLYTTWSASSTGRFNNAMSKYIGVKFLAGDGNMHYGWAEVSVGFGGNSDNSNITLLNYAYEDNELATGILAGSLVGVKKNDDSNVNVYSFGKGIHINNGVKGASVNVYDLAGKQVYSGLTKGSTTKVDMSGHEGLYVVKVKDNTRKVYIN